jgi:hypothetical protein
MHSDEDIERIRQAIMRLHELMELMRHHLHEGETAYEALFATLTPEERTLPYKTQQRVIAETLLDSSTQPLADIALRLRLHARDFEREFENVHDKVVSSEL